MFQFRLWYAVLSIPCRLVIACWKSADWPIGSCVCCVFMCFVTCFHVSWFISELRVRLVPLNMFKPSSIFCWPFQGGASFVDLFCFYVSCLSLLCCLDCSLRCLDCSLQPCNSFPWWFVCVLLFLVFLSLSQVRSGTWLHRFLIFAILFTLIYF